MEEEWLKLPCHIRSGNNSVKTYMVIVRRIGCCGIIILYTVQICHLNWFNKMLIGQDPGRKYR